MKIRDCCSEEQKQSDRQRSKYKGIRLYQTPSVKNTYTSHGYSELWTEDSPYHFYSQHESTSLTSNSCSFQGLGPSHHDCACNYPKSASIHEICCRVHCASFIPISERWWKHTEGFG